MIFENFYKNRKVDALISKRKVRSYDAKIYSNKNAVYTAQLFAQSLANNTSFNCNPSTNSFA